MARETRKRTILKSLSWRICGTLVTACGIYVLTGKADLSLTIASLDFLLKIVGYYLHDRLWTVIAFGYEIEPGTANVGTRKDVGVAVVDASSPELVTSAPVSNRR